MASVELKDLRKTFGMVSVIHGVNLSVADGEFVALVGPSGCGKSTLLRMIAGLEDATDGDVLIGDKVVTELNSRQRNVAMVFQSYALYPHMTVAQNMGFNLKLSGNSKVDIKRKVDEAARLLELTDLLGRRPFQLSGGQRQRVAMGRAIVRDPSVFLFDEPLSNLDAKLRVQMRSEIKALHQKVKTTSIYVTHDQIEAMTLADRIVVLNKGRIEQEGSPIELYRNPANLFVAGFIGSPAMNVIDATAVVDGRQAAGRLSDGTLIPVDGKLPLADGQAVVLGIRPEHMAERGKGAEVRSTVLLVEPTGAQTQLTFELCGKPIVAVTEGNYEGSPGDVFVGHVAPAHVHVFDRQSGQRIGVGSPSS
jgi:multiple sugar transport system ATP-binding protein